MTGLKNIMAIMAALLILAGCAVEAEATPVVLGETNVKEAVVVADPQAAVDAIYASLKEYTAEDLDGERMEAQLGLDFSDVSEFYGQISDATDGLSDVIIILPDNGSREKVQLALSRYKESRMAEFENYDILGAYSIAQNAVIYDQGDYVIMLMLPDNDAARDIIDEHIPL